MSSAPISILTAMSECRTCSPAILMWIGSCVALPSRAGWRIDPENTLIILDEIQEVPAALQEPEIFL